MRQTRRENEMVTYEMVHKLNEVAQSDFEHARVLLNSLNEVCGTEYGWLDKRVVYSDAPRSHTADYYANCHDLESTLKYDNTKTEFDMCMSVIRSYRRRYDDNAKMYRDDAKSFFGEGDVKYGKLSLECMRRSAAKRNALDVVLDHLEEKVLEMKAGGE